MENYLKIFSENNLEKCLTIYISQIMNSELEATKQQLNHNRKLSYNMCKYPFLKTKEETELWIKNRRFYFPFAKALDDNDDVDSLVDILTRFLVFKQTQIHEESESD